MTSQFIRYTPDIEADDLQFDQNLQTLIGKTERYIAGSVTSEGTGRAVRAAHAQGYGLVKGEVEIPSRLPAEHAQGIYAKPGRHGALIRFSNGSAHVGADAGLGSTTGLSLKIFGVDGPTLLDDDPNTGTFDYANINAPIFFCNTVEHYLFIQDLVTDAPTYFSQGRPGAHRFFREWVTGKGTLAQDQWAWDEFLAFLTLAQIPAVNLLLSTYWTMGSVRHGDYIAKLRIAPAPAFAERVIQRSLDLESAREVSRPALVAELQARPYEFDIQVQLCADLARMPVEDLTVNWPEKLSPFVTVAKLRIPQQDISGPDSLEKLDALSFSPWRVTADHAPLGNMMRAAGRSTATPPSCGTSSTSRKGRSPRTHPTSCPEAHSTHFGSHPWQTKPIPQSHPKYRPTISRSSGNPCAPRPTVWWNRLWVIGEGLRRRSARRCAGTAAKSKVCPPEPIVGHLGVPAHELAGAPTQPEAAAQMSRKGAGVDTPQELGTLGNLWTIEDLSNLLRFPMGTIYPWRHRGEGPPAVRLGSYLRRQAATVHAWVQSQRG